MTYPPAMLPPSRWSRFRDWVLVWVCGTLLGMLAGEVVMGSYEAGLTSFKPSIFLWGSVFFCLGMTVISQPKFCPAILFVLILPVWRVLDVALLARFEQADLGEVTMNTLRTLLMLLAVLGVLSTDKGRSAALWAAVVAIFMTTGSELFEAGGYARFTSITGRFSGFSGHPNAPPMILCQMLGIVFALSKNFRLNLLMLAVAVPGVALTYGRSGMICLGLMGLVYVALNARQHSGFILACLALGLPLLGAGFTFLQSNTQKGVMKDKDTAGRLEAIYELDFDKLKSPERARDLADAWDGAMQKPLFGQGVGSSGTVWAPHNEVVSIWLELGMIGAAVFALLHLGLTLGSALRGGAAGFCVYAIWFYVPAAQGRIDTMHYWLTVAVAVHVIWEKRYAFTWRSLRAGGSTPGHPRQPHFAS